MADWEAKLTTRERREWERFVAHVRENTVEQMAESAFVMSLCPGSEPDIKFAVETGLAILLDKPIIVIATAGCVMPSGLRRVAHAVIEVDDIDTEAGKLELERKLQPILDEFGVHHA